MFRTTNGVCNVLKAMMVAVWLIVLTPLQGGAEGHDNFRISHYARSGETLEAICRNLGLDTDLVAAMNNLPSEARMNQGKIIYLPREPEVKYTVQEGDTLWDIGYKHHIDVKYLLSLNEIDNPHKLQIGQIIRIPDCNGEEVESIHQIRTPRLPVKAPPVKVASRAPGSFLMPVEGVITSGFGERKGGFHHGTDFAAPIGTPIKAVKAGKVTFVGRRPIYGNMVIIDHGGEVKSVYGHASKLLVENGERIEKGQVIAQVGSTGRSTGPHLHLEIHFDGQVVNPVRYLQKN